LIGLRNCFWGRLEFGINTGGVVFLNPNAKLCCIQSEALVDLGFSMSHQDDLQRRSPEA
jgi:hypothetical protein